jgi:GAF domain-containing protein
MPAAPAEAPTASPLVERLRTGLAAMTDIRKLLEELPTVADVVEMAEALLAEVGFAFSPQIASVYIREGNIFRIVASRGLSRVEQNLEISEEHQLFSQVLLSSEPILIAPVDLARGLVAGIGGAHTEAMMVGPIHADGECIGALVLGRPDFTDSDLDVLANLAREAGPGLAFARALRALRDWPL